MSEELNQSVSVPEAVPMAAGNEGQGDEGYDFDALTRVKVDPEKSKIDMIASAVMFFCGLFVVIESIKMPSQQLSGSAWYTTPGIFPCILGMLLMATSIIMAILGYKYSGGMKSGDIGRAFDYVRSRYVKRLGIALALFLAYVFVLLGNKYVHYMLATFLYLVPNMLIFDPKPLTKSSVVKYIVTSAAFAVAVGYSFQEFARIPLP